MMDSRKVGIDVRFGTMVDALKSASLNGFRLALRDRQLAREYVSQSLRRFDELMGYGLRRKNPLTFIYEQGWATRRPQDRVEVPAVIEPAGGTQLDELVLLATVTRVLRPRKVFEIGTFMGQTTSVFVLNAPRDATVVTMDLPPATEPEPAAYIDTDVILVKQRKVGSFLQTVGLTGRYEQILCDSMQFDPVPHAGSVELGFIDGAHSRDYVDNDTRKMAMMMSERGLVFWHDYGGKGRFRGLTDHLDRLARTVAIYRVPGMSLAWTPASELRKLT
jgi:hypothetical protein